MSRFGKKQLKSVERDSKSCVKEKYGKVRLLRKSMEKYGKIIYCRIIMRFWNLFRESKMSPKKATMA